MRKFAILALFVFVVCTSWVSAQRIGAQTAGSSFAHFSNARPAHGSPALSGSLSSRPEFSAFRRFYPGAPYRDFLSSFGIFSDSLQPSDPASYGYAAAAPPNFFLMPSLPSAGITEDQPQPAPQALMIELRGDRYVRVTNSDENTENNPAPANYRQPAIASSERDRAAPKRGAATSAVLGGSSSVAKPAASSELPPTILIFRDGHSESVRDYAIADGVIYARGNYYTDGYWNKKIEVSTLNVPHTVKSNEARGVRFLLPAAPNEVITRP